MKIRNMLLAAAIMAGLTNVEGKEVKQPDSYAYTRGMECLNEGKYEDARALFAQMIMNNDLLESLPDKEKRGLSYSELSKINTK